MPWVQWPALQFPPSELPVFLHPLRLIPYYTSRTGQAVRAFLRRSKGQLFGPVEQLVTAMVVIGLAIQSGQTPTRDTSGPFSAHSPANTSLSVPAPEPVSSNEASSPAGLVVPTITVLLSTLSWLNLHINMTTVLVALLGLNALLLVIPFELRSRLKASWDVFWPPWQERSIPGARSHSAEHTASSTTPSASILKETAVRGVAVEGSEETKQISTSAPNSVIPERDPMAARPKPKGKERMEGERPGDRPKKSSGPELAAPGASGSQTDASIPNNESGAITKMLDKLKREIAKLKSDRDTSEPEKASKLAELENKRHKLKAKLAAVTAGGIAGATAGLAKPDESVKLTDPGLNDPALIEKQMMRLKGKMEAVKVDTSLSESERAHKMRELDKMRQKLKSDQRKLSSSEKEPVKPMAKSEAPADQPKVETPMPPELQKQLERLKGEMAAIKANPAMDERERDAQLHHLDKMRQKLKVAAARSRTTAPLTVTQSAQPAVSPVSPEAKLGILSPSSGGPALSPDRSLPRLIDDPLLSGESRQLKSALKKSTKKPRQKKNIHHNYFMTMRGWRPALTPFPHGFHPRPEHPRHTLWWDNVPHDADHIMATPQIAKEPEVLRKGEDESGDEAARKKQVEVPQPKTSDDAKTPSAHRERVLEKIDKLAPPAHDSADKRKEDLPKPSSSKGRAEADLLASNEAKQQARVKASKPEPDASRNSSSRSGPLQANSIPPAPPADLQLQKATWITQGMLCALLWYLHEQLALSVAGFFIWQHLQDRRLKDMRLNPASVTSTGVAAFQRGDRAGSTAQDPGPISDITKDRPDLVNAEKSSDSSVAPGQGPTTNRAAGSALRAARTTDPQDPSTKAEPPLRQSDAVETTLASPRGDAKRESPTSRAAHAGASKQLSRQDRGLLNADIPADRLVGKNTSRVGVDRNPTGVMERSDHRKDSARAGARADASGQDDRCATLNEAISRAKSDRKASRCDETAETAPDTAKPAQVVVARSKRAQGMKADKQDDPGAPDPQAREKVGRLSPKERDKHERPGLEGAQMGFEAGAQMGFEAGAAATSPTEDSPAAVKGSFAVCDDPAKTPLAHQDKGTIKGLSSMIRNGGRAAQFGTPSTDISDTNQARNHPSPDKREPKLVDTGTTAPSAFLEPWQDAVGEPGRTASYAEKNANGARRRALEIAKAARRTDRLSTADKRSAVESTADPPIPANSPVGPQRRSGDRENPFNRAGSRMTHSGPTLQAPAVFPDSDVAKQLQSNTRTTKKQRVGMEPSVAAVIGEAARSQAASQLPIEDRHREIPSRRILLDEQAAEIAGEHGIRTSPFPIGAKEPRSIDKAALSDVAHDELPRTVTPPPEVRVNQVAKPPRRAAPALDADGAAAEPTRGGDRSRAMPEVEPLKTLTPIELAPDVRLARKALASAAECATPRRRSSSVGSFGVITFAGPVRDIADGPRSAPILDSFAADKSTAECTSSVAIKERKSADDPGQHERSVGSARTPERSKILSTDGDGYMRVASDASSRSVLAVDMSEGQSVEAGKHPARASGKRQAKTGGSEKAKESPKATVSETRSKRLEGSRDRPARDQAKSKLRLEDLTPEDVERLQRAREKRKVEKAKAEKTALGQGSSGLTVEEKEGLTSP